MPTLAEQLAAVLQGESSLLQLRAARTLLAMTRDAARKVGRERPDAAQQDASPKAPPAQEVVHEHEHVHVHDSGTHPTQQAYECRAASPP